MHLYHYQLIRKSFFAVGKIKMNILKGVIFIISVFSATLCSAQKVNGCVTLDHLTITEMIRSCKDVAKDKSKKDTEIAHAAFRVANLLRVDKVGTPEEIIGYYLLSAQKGKISAFAEIGDMYREGYKGLKPDYKKAKYYYSQDTSLSATYFAGIAEMHLHGHEFEKSVDLAIWSFRTAAGLDDSDSLSRMKLCEIFSNDDYQKKDLVKAHFWCSSAVEAQSYPFLKGLFESDRLKIELQLSESQLIESNNIQQKCRKFGILYCSGTY